MTNTTSDHIIVSSSMGRLLQTTATGASRFSEAEVRTAAVLYEKVLTEGYDGFENVTVCGGNKVSLTVDADLLKLTVNAPATVTTTAAAKVYHFRANRAATVTGYGSVYQADVRMDGVSFAKDVTLGGYTLASGVSVMVARRKPLRARPRFLHRASSLTSETRSRLRTAWSFRFRPASRRKSCC